MAERKRADSGNMNEMKNKEKIQSALTTSGPMCDDCISTSTVIKPRQTVNIACRELEQCGELQRKKDMCPQCKKVKIVNFPEDGSIRPVKTIRIRKDIQRPAKKIIKPAYKEGRFPSGKMQDVVANLTQMVSDGELDIYNEFSLQHELGILLRKEYPDKLIQFERNVSFFGFTKTNFVKREIDIVVYDNKNMSLDAVIELKYPRSGQHPEQMYSFCKDVVFAEQLKKFGFNKAFVVIFADDRLFYEGSIGGIYGYFRGGKDLSGTIAKPTGNQESNLEIAGNYKVVWDDVCDSLKYTVIEAQ